MSLAMWLILSPAWLTGAFYALAFLWAFLTAFAGLDEDAEEEYLKGQGRCHQCYGYRDVTGYCRSCPPFTRE
jgi:hypothetical protein